MNQKEFLDLVHLALAVEFAVLKPKTQKDCWVIIRDYAQALLDSAQ